ncbi:MAG: DegV family protein [Anaerolineae bacterium]|jgi:DegV family protein with EDD domain|nr:DegV family protein [Anaerolineae bacterium]
MTIHILTDSSHYLDPATIASLNIHVLPLTLHLAGEDRRERIEVTTEDLFAALKDRNAGWPTTAAVSPAALTAAYDEWTRDGDEVVGVFMSRGTSVTVENAQAAAADHPNRDRIHIVDSLVISGALGLTLHVVAQRAAEGMAAADLARVARTMGERMRVMFTVDTLDYLHRGGRMKGSQALVGTLLGIKPVLWLNEGRIELWSRARGKKKALETMLDETVKVMPAGEPVQALIFDAAADAEAEALGRALRERLQVDRLYRCQIGPVVAAHVGPGCVAMGVCPVSATC